MWPTAQVEFETPALECVLIFDKKPKSKHVEILAYSSIKNLSFILTEKSCLCSYVKVFAINSIYSIIEKQRRISQICI